MIAPNALEEALPQVTVVPVKPLSRVTYSAPVVGVEYPWSSRSVHPVGGVMVAGLVELPTTPSVGLPVRQEEGKTGAGVPAAALGWVFDCRTAVDPVLDIPATRHIWMMQPVAESPVQLKVSVRDEAAAS